MGNNKLHSTINLRCIGSFSDFGDILIAMFLPELSDKLSDVYTAPIGHLGLAVGNVRRVRRFSPPLLYGITKPQWDNSLAPGRSENHFKIIVFGVLFMADEFSAEKNIEIYFWGSFNSLAPGDVKVILKVYFSNSFHKFISWALSVK